MHGFLWFIGVNPVPDGTSVMYQLWSGFIPALTVLTLIAGVIQLYRRHNCAQHRCWRIGRHPAANGTLITCRKHHPDLGEGPLTAERIAALHQKTQ